MTEHDVERITGKVGQVDRVPSDTDSPAGGTDAPAKTPLEDVYDERIAPLQAQINEICRDEGIQFLSSFVLDTPKDGEFAGNPLRCTSAEISTDRPLKEALRALGDPK